MANTAFFQSLSIKNYRGIKRAKIEGFLPVNIIAGMNGSGKSTILEALFTILDAMGPLAIIRPMALRQLPASIAFAHSALFRDGEEAVQFEAKTADGPYELTFKWEDQTQHQASFTIPDTEKFGRRAIERTRGSEGITMSVFRSKKLIMRRSFNDSAGSLAINDSVPSSIRFPIGTIITRSNAGIHSDLANKFTGVIQNRRKDEILRIIRYILADVKDIQLLQLGDQGILHVELGDGNLIPLSLAGDGVVILTAIALTMMTSEGGVVFLDEFDASIHYTKLEVVWSIIEKLAKEYECQVFAATHSRECVDAALSVSKNSGKDVMRFFRMDSVDNNISITSYGQDELDFAYEQSMEIR